MKTAKLNSMLAAAALCAAGCTSVATFDYEGARGTMIRVSPNGGTKSVAVMPFMDQRGAYTGDHRYNDRGSYWLGWIPFIPCGFEVKGSPEKSDGFITLERFHVHPQEDFAAAAAASLRRSGLFANVSQANSDSQVQTDYVFRGRVKAVTYEGDIWSCCITYGFAAGLWVLGVPYATSFNSLSVEFELVECATGNKVWGYAYDGSDYLNHWIYQPRSGEDVSLFAALLKEAMNGAVVNMAQTVPGLAR
jgi:hypothetical protein